MRWMCDVVHVFEYIVACPAIMLLLTGVKTRRITYRRGYKRKEPVSTAWINLI